MCFQAAPEKREKFIEVEWCENSQRGLPKGDEVKSKRMKGGAFATYLESITMGNKFYYAAHHTSYAKEGRKNHNEKLSDDPVDPVSGRRC